MSTSTNHAENVSRTEAWLVFAVSAGVCFLAGYLAWLGGQARWEALAALSHAFDVVHRQPRFNLTLIGFAMPPLPALLYLPLCGFFPQLASSGIACPILGSAMLGGTAVVLNSACASARIPALPRWLLTASFVVNPIVLSHAAAGADGIIIIFTVMGAAIALSTWLRTDNLRHLIICSLLLTAAILTRYEAIWLVVAAAAYIAWHITKQGDGWARIEGTLISFLLPVCYCAIVWIGANWAIVGEPFQFWNLSLRPGAVGDGQFQSWARYILTALLLSCPPILGLLYHEFTGGVVDEPSGRPAACLLIGVIAGTVLLSGAQTSAPGIPWLQLTTPAGSTIAVGYLLLAIAAGRYIDPERTVIVRPLAGTVLLIAAGFAIVFWLRASGRGILPVTTPKAINGRIAFTADTRPERQIAERIRKNMTGAEKACIIGGPAFAISLYSGKPHRLRIMDRSLQQNIHPKSGDFIAIHNSADPIQVRRRLTLSGVNTAKLLWENSRWQMFRIERSSPPAGRYKQ